MAISLFLVGIAMLFCVILSTVREPTDFVTYSTVIACHEYKASHVDYVEI